MSKINANDQSKFGRYSESYSRNQCSIMIRVDGNEVEVPLNFGMTSDEIKKLYPFILQFAEMPSKNPALQFTEDECRGKYSDLSQEDIDALKVKVREQSRFWFDKSEASVLDIAIRFALDIQLKGIAELVDIFSPVSSLESIKVDPISDAEAEQIIQDMRLETEVDREFDAGDECDIPLGIAGGLDVNLYASTEDDDYLSQELDAMEAKLDVEDTFTKIINDESLDADDGRYESAYKPGVVSQDMLSMYDDDAPNVFDELDALEKGDILEAELDDVPTNASDVTVSYEDDDGDEDDYDWEDDEDDE